MVDDLTQKRLLGSGLDQNVAEDAIEQIRRGFTTLDEVLKVLPIVLGRQQSPSEVEATYPVEDVEIGVS